jgi:hypothetical protein
MGEAELNPLAELPGTGTFRPSCSEAPMAAKRTIATAEAATAEAATAEAATAEPFPANGGANLPEWMAQAVQQGLKPEQALACIGLGLMGKLADGGKDLPWIWNEEEDGDNFDGTSLRQRLELVQLALQTGAPLSTAEVTHLMGARPGAAVVQRGGLTARRLSRNVWKLSRSNEDSERASTTGFGEGFRRRL